MTIKIKEVHQLIRLAWNAGTVRLSRVHGNQRSTDRLIGMTEIRDVILYGDREEEHDSYIRTHWVYAIRNRNVDGNDIRIIFDIKDHPNVIIVTVMHVYP